MATKQTDTVAMTDEQLDGVSGGPHYSDWNGSRHNVIQFDGVQGGGSWNGSQGGLRPRVMADTRFVSDVDFP